MRKGMKSSAAINRVHAAKQFRTGGVSCLDSVSSSGGCIPGNIDGDTYGGHVQIKGFHFCDSTPSSVETTADGFHIFFVSLP